LEYRGFFGASVIGPTTFSVTNPPQSKGLTLDLCLKQPYLTLIGACLSLAPLHAALPQSADELRRLEELDRICLNVRGEKIRQVQRQKIEACVKESPVPREAPKSRAECERFWGDYG